MISEEKFAGNKRIVGYLNKTLANGRIMHAYMFEGAQHLGKTTLALHFACELLGDTFENLHRNPDFIRVAPNEDENQISVEAVREMQKALSLSPFGAQYKVAIIENAQMMNRTAANSLLKTLEEPGKTSVIILTASNAEKVLDTIKSRCQILSMGMVSPRILEKFLCKRGEFSPAVLENILELSQGKPGLAVELLEDAGLSQKMQERKKEVLDIFQAGNFQKLEGASSVYALEKEAVAAVLDVWVGTLRLEMLKSFNDRSREGMARTVQMKNSIEKIISAKEDILEKNVNLRLSIENLVLSFK